MLPTLFGNRTQRKEMLRPSWWDADNMFHDFDRFFGNSLTGVNDFNIVENDNDFTIEMDLPGFEANDVRLELNNGVLFVDAKKRSDKSNGFRRRFSRSFRLSEGLREDQIEASLKNGVLTITIPKSEEGKPKQIPVKSI